MSKFVAINGNKINDSLNRKGVSAVYQMNKNKAKKRAQLEDPETKQQLMDWLFSGKDTTLENPLG